jgi:hypothetical protein
MSRLPRAFALLAFGLLAFADRAASGQPAPGPESIPLRLLNVRPLIFPTAFQGDPSHVVAPAASDEGAALFVITGHPFLTVSLQLPEDDVELFTLSFEQGPKSLRIRRLITQPPEGESFHLGLLGLRKVYVGGTRDAIHRRQASGPYLGRFFLTVVHQ